MRYEIRKERIYLHCPAVNIVMAVDIEGEIAPEEFKRALAMAVDRHELLGCRVATDEDGRAFFETGSPRPVSLDTCPDREGAVYEILERERRSAYDVENGEWMRCALLTRKGGATWVLSAHHLVGDGTALLFFIRDVLACYQLPDVSRERLPVSLFTADKAPKAAKLPFKTKLLASVVNASWKRGKRVFSRAEYTDMQTRFWEARGETACEKACLEGAELEGILEACRRHGVTLTGLLIAALQSASGQADCGLAVSVRPPEMEGMGNWATGITVTHAPDTSCDLWQNAAPAQLNMKEKLDDPAKKFFLLRFMDAVSPTLTDAAYYAAYAGYASEIAQKAAAMFGYGADAKALSLTNLTRAPIPIEYGGARIREIAFWPPFVPNALRLVGAVTVGDRLVLTMQTRKHDAGLLGKAVACIREAVK